MWLYASNQMFCYFFYASWACVFEFNIQKPVYSLRCCYCCRGKLFFRIRTMGKKFTVFQCCALLYLKLFLFSRLVLFHSPAQPASTCAQIQTYETHSHINSRQNEVSAIYFVRASFKYGCRCGGCCSFLDLVNDYTNNKQQNYVQSSEKLKKYKKIIKQKRRNINGFRNTVRHRHSIGLFRRMIVEKWRERKKENWNVQK